MDHGIHHPRILFLSLSIVLLLVVGFLLRSEERQAFLISPTLSNISEEVKGKSDAYIATRALQSYRRVRLGLASTSANANFSSVLTAEAANVVEEDYRLAEAYAAESIKRAAAAYEKDKTSLEARKSLVAVILALRAAQLSQRTAASAGAVASASAAAQSFNTGVLGQASGLLGVSQQVVVTSPNSGPTTAQTVFVGKVNTGGGAGAIAAGISGLPSWGIIGNAVGGVVGSAPLGQVVVSSSAGASFNFTLPTGAATTNSVGGTVGTITQSGLGTTGGFDYGGFDRPENLPSGASSNSCAPRYGSLCTSPANVCGIRNPGRITCDGYCSAITPGSDACPTPSIYTSGDTVFVRPGQSCTFSWVAENAQVCHFYGTYNASPFSFWTLTSQQFTSVPLNRRQSYNIDCFADRAGQSVSSRRTVSCIPRVPTLNEQ